MRSPTKPKDSLSKVLPLRWSFGSRDRIKPPAPAQPGELVEYLESGRRPRCTKDPIITLVATPPQRSAPGRTAEAGHDCSSPSSSSLSCTDRPGSDTCYSPKIAAGQSRSCMERAVSQAVCNSRARDYGSLRQRSLKRARQEQGRTLDLQLQLHRGALLGDQVSHSAPPSRDSTLRRSKMQTGPGSRPHRDFSAIQAEDRRGQRGQEGRSHDSLLSFFKAGFLKKDSPVWHGQGLERPFNGQLGKLAGSNSAKLSLSNGTLATEERRAGGGPYGCEAPSCRALLLNGKATHLDAADIKRAHSSSNIQTKLELTFRRCGSLQRNGEVVGAAAHPAHRILLADKAGYATLQRTRYSTTSLGRHTVCPAF